MVYTKTIIHLVSVKVVDIYLDASRLGKYPSLFTSSLVNNKENISYCKVKDKKAKFTLVFYTF